MASYIAFDTPPTVAELLASWDPVPPDVAASRWRTSTFVFAPPPPPGDPKDSPPIPPDDHADLTLGYDDPSVLDRTNVYKNALFDDDGEASDDSRREKSRRGPKKDDEEEHNRRSKWSLESSRILPPPTASQRLNQATQFFSLANESYVDHSFASTRGNDSDGSYEAMGAPPYLPWDPSSLVKLNQLSHTFRHWNGDGKPVVSVLAAVADVRRPVELASGKLKAEWDLVDETGAQMNLTMWGDIARDWSEGIRRRDIIFLGGLGLGKYNEKLQLKPDTKSELQICWRTQVTEEDRRYAFHESHGQLSEAALAVLDIVKWFGRAYPQRQ